MGKRGPISMKGKSFKELQWIVKYTKKTAPAAKRQLKKMGF
jgi:hypothetical protein